MPPGEARGFLEGASSFPDDRRQLAMSMEFTLARADSVFLSPPHHPTSVAMPPRAWRPLAQVALTGLVLAYIYWMVQDFQRVRNLQAEPSTSPKVVITKNEAWERIYPRPSRSGT
jgi:hypothetical protein